MNRNSAQHNIESITLVASRLQELCDDVTFVGGSILGLLITDLAAPDVRYTIDVDCIVDIVTLSSYHVFSKKLKKKGFKELHYGNHPICRWDCNGVLVDIVPTDKNVLGFSNKWYKDAMENAETTEINRSLQVKVITAPYFIATKLEAFLDRGSNDFLSSHDMEDIITVLDGRTEIIAELEKTEKGLINFISSQFSAFITDHQFINALPGHLNYTSEFEARKKVILQRMHEIIALGEISLPIVS